MSEKPNKHKPLNVVIMEDDDYSRWGLTALLERDARIRVYGAFESSAQLLAAMATERAQSCVDVVLIDIDHFEKLDLARLIADLNALSGGIPVVCISEYAPLHHELLAQALAAHANGFLAKTDVRYAIASALLIACKTGFVYSPAVEPLLLVQAREKVQMRHRIEAWRLHPDLCNRFEPVARKGILQRMSARQIAEEELKPEGADKDEESTERAERWTQQAVETMRREIYRILEAEYGARFYNSAYLPKALVQGLAPMERAFHILTLPPRRAA